ncbi:translation initiation factor IF-2-like [Salvelinus namaycush]|uniref:Translation initiation factor IF-2-like n=1 Tax=Salvelinus namaycush TaxID=8040 RepID=A0A8U0R005_SALNM|nr:translation initiation factor IF-2-like [Salvelinus namaycush]
MQYGKLEEFVTLVTDGSGAADLQAEGPTHPGTESEGGPWFRPWLERGEVPGSGPGWSEERSLVQALVGARRGPWFRPWLEQGEVPGSGPGWSKERSLVQALVGARRGPWFRPWWGCGQGPGGGEEKSLVGVRRGPWLVRGQGPGAALVGARTGPWLGRGEGPGAGPGWGERRALVGARGGPWCGPWLGRGERWKLFYLLFSTSQTASILNLTLTDLEECEQSVSVSDPEHLKTLLQHHRHPGHLKEDVLFYDSDTILSTLFLLVPSLESKPTQRGGGKGRVKTE